MNKIDKISGISIPLDMNNVDTDLIIPAQYLTSVKKQGFGEHLFQRLRDNNPDFVFNQKKYHAANILIAKENFGCGSSREHAVWALKEAGIEAIIAVSFADIFFNNAAKNGLLLIKQPKTIIEEMLGSAPENYTIDLKKQTIEANQKMISFEIDHFNKYCFVEGLDELDYLISNLEKIKQYKSQGKGEANG
jgi:3-isopropylmalate/(R)-2-methylmalate dehydratase small subunit